MNEVLLRSVPPISHAEAMAIAESQNEAFLRELRQLEATDWDKPTDCVGWSVRDIVAHLLGWAEAMTSPREAVAQTVGAVKRRKAFPSLVDAQNEVQVDARRWLSTTELIERLERSLPRFLKVRDRAGKALKPVPYMSGPTGWTTIGFIAEHIFTRDVFMHRIDIARALGRELVVETDERRIFEDCLREWALGSGAHATLELGGAAAGTYVAGSGDVARIGGDSIDLCRFFAGRAVLEDLTIDGDRERAVEWLKSPVRF
jgi:uncharacterized protein (TIGR03083 family)